MSDLVKQPEKVEQCANLAATYIVFDKEQDERFQECFDWSGSDAVKLELLLRANSRPNGALQQKIFNFIPKESADRLLAKYKGMLNTEKLAQDTLQVA